MHSVPSLYTSLSRRAFACSACALMYCTVPAYPWRWRRSTASWSPAGLGVVSPSPCTMRQTAFDPALRLSGPLFDW